MDVHDVLHGMMGNVVPGQPIIQRLDPSPIVSIQQCSHESLEMALNKGSEFFSDFVLEDLLYNLFFFSK